MVGFSTLVVNDSPASLGLGRKRRRVTLPTDSSSTTTTTSTSRNSSRRQDRFPVADEQHCNIHCRAPDRENEGDEEEDADDPSVSVPCSYGVVVYWFFGGSILRGLAIASSFCFWFVV